jgi:hypothetical protein
MIPHRARIACVIGIVGAVLANAESVAAFSVCGRAGEFPGANAPLARNVFFTLDPLGVSTRSTSSGIFCFDDVPPGAYTISVREVVGAPTPCNLYGCWPETPVTVIDADILNIVIVMEELPEALTCRCLANGGNQGPGGCPCDVQACFDNCVDSLCGVLPNCMLECSFRCSCNRAPQGCLTHIDPGPTPTSVPESPCPGDSNADHRVTIDELVGAVANALNGCPQ